MSGHCLVVTAISLLLCLAVYAREQKCIVENAAFSGPSEKDLGCDQLACLNQDGSSQYEATSARVRATLQLLRKGDQEIQTSKKCTHVILALGNTGAGKSTFTQWISGNNELEAKESADNDGTYLIVDKHDRISEFTMDSKTIFPELVTDNITNTYYYDYPGFGDTRGSSNDIATSYFINKVFEHVEAVKLLFVVSYTSVRSGVDRQDFFQLLKHATELVKDIDKYKESIALVVTKVDNQYIKRGKKLIFIEDPQVIKSIGGFLNETKLSLENRIQNLENTLKDSKFYENSLKFVDILLSHNDNGYTKIGIFRRPEELGSISDNPILNKEKNQINQVLQTLNFTKINTNDFGYTLTEKSLNEINYLVEEINKNISTNLNCIVQILHTHYTKLGKLAESKIASFHMNSSPDKVFTTVKIYLAKINEGYDATENVTFQIKNIQRVQDLTKYLLIGMFDLDASKGMQKVMSDISTQSKYFDFLQTFVVDHSYKKTMTISWASYFQDLLKEFVKIETKLQSNIKKLEQEIEIKVKHDIDIIEKSIRKHFTEKEKNVRDITSLHKFLEQEYEKISTIHHLISERNSDLYISEVLNYLGRFNIKVEEPTISMLNKSKYVDIVDQAIKTNLEYVRDSWKYYEFLHVLYTKLSVYEIQKDTTQLLKLSKEITQSEENKRIFDTTMEQFLTKCCYAELKSRYDNIKNVTLDQFKLRTLHKIFTLTLKHDIETHCKNDNELVVRGYFVKLSDAVLKHCPKPITTLKIFALHTVFIDIDLNKTGEGFQIAIIAPTWDVRGSRNIILDGSPGLAHSSSTAMSGLYPGNNGQDGKPGLPGGRGGIFFGIGMELINGRLFISSNGGNGGPGQNGGNGMRGADGTIPSTNDPLNYLKEKGLYNNEYKIKEHPACNRKYYCLMFVIEWNIFGQNCTDGGKGGNGGRGGFGGYPGIIKTIFLSSDARVNTRNKLGNNGTDGKGGTGGSSGLTGEVLVIQRSYSFSYDKKYKKMEECIPGTNGKTLNENGIEERERPYSLYASHILNEFKSYLRDSFTGAISNSSLMKFIDSLDNSKSINELYDIPGLINELYSLETELHKVNEKTLLVPFYRSLLKRIDQFIEKIKFGTINTKNYKTLQYLRIATLSSLYKIFDSKDNLVVDIKEYFVLLEKHIKQYQTALKEVKLDTHKNQYIKIINSQIQEAESLIEQSLMSEIDDIYHQIDNQITFLIKDVKNQQNATEKEKNILIEKQKKLASQLPLRGILGALKLTGQFLALAGPAGKIAGQMIGAGVEIVDKIAIDKPDNVIGNFNKSFGDIKIYYEKEQKYLKKNLEISMKGEGSNKSDTELEKIITPLNKSLNQSNVTAYYDIKKSTKVKLQQYVQLLVKKKDALNKTDEITSVNSTETREQEIKNKLKYAKLLLNAIILAEVGFDSVVNTKETKDLINDLGDNIRSHDEHISKLKDYEISIYRAIVPMRTDLENTVNEMGSKLSNRSHASLSVQNWRIENIIKDFQFNIAFMIQASDPKIKSKVLACLDKLQNGMTTMVRVYDMIQSYQENVRLSKFIADLNSEVKISDDEQINSDIDKLEVITKSNLVLQEYEKAVTAFKQYMFPFAPLYFEMFNLPNQPHNITDLVHSASLHINFMVDELTKKTTVIQRNSQQLFPDISFDHTAYEHEPFYVWGIEKYEKEITDLLKGKEVTLKADLAKAVNKNAIKFKELGVQFILSDENVQKEFDKLSQGFLVNMTHSGNSYYKCDERHYVITHSVINMKHSMSKDTSGHYYYLDMTSHILKKNPPIISPYTIWNIQLVPKVVQGHSLEMFDKYATLVKKLVLEGRGQYVGLNLDVCNDHLDKYYQQVDL